MTMSNPNDFVAGYRIEDALAALRDARNHPMPAGAAAAVEACIVTLESCQHLLPSPQAVPPSCRFPAPSDPSWSNTPIVALPPVRKP